MAGRALKATQEAVQLVIRGAPIKETAKLYGLSVSTVTKALRRAGVPKGPKLATTKRKYEG